MKLIKNFLKPDWRKILIFLVLLIVFLSFKHSIGYGELFFPVKGLPLPIESEEFSWAKGYPRLILYLIIDLLFWYCISCLIIWIYDKFRKTQ